MLQLAVAVPLNMTPSCLCEQGRTKNAKAQLSTPAPLPSSHEQRMTNDAALPLLLSSSHEQGATIGAKVPLLLPSYALPLLPLLCKQGKIDNVEAPSLLPSHPLPSTIDAKM
jgi:hypothetical protein